MEELFERPFDINEVSQETKQKIDDLQNAIINSKGHQKELLYKELQDLIVDEEDKHRKKYPGNPPNENCHTAIISGLQFSNEIGLAHHDLRHYFSIENETAFLWLHTKNELLALVVDVEPVVKSQTVWRNLASIIELTVSISSFFEHTIDCDYDWIYSFDPQQDIRVLKFLIPRNYHFISGTQFKASFFAKNASIIELLVRDECFYVMAMNLLISFFNHSFCLHCAFRKKGYQDHPNHEIPLWQIARAIPNMEVAIVQATKVVEAALGKPGKRDVPSKYQRVIDRWNKAVIIEPNGYYNLANMSNIDYYYQMFDIRGDAAHSLGNISYQKSRQQTIETQCFAWIILNGYFKKHSISNAAARKAINLK